jgi:NAD(P)-dependent dehydrogenase (short-subunit alcohol dehydrogenase family)
MELTQRVAVVTGGGAGIGEAVSIRLAREGASVVVVDIDPDGARATVERITAAGGRSAPVQADVASEEEVGAIVGQAVSRFGRVDVLVNNAGGADDIAYPATPPERWGRTIDVNLRGVMLVTQACLGAMSRHGGVIVNIASLAGVGHERHGSPEYAAAKAGVVRLTTALAGLAEDGIRVNCICPDWVDTPASRRTRARMTPDELAAVPQPLLSPADIAEAVMTFVADESLAGRVMECWCRSPPRLMGLEKA